MKSTGIVRKLDELGRIVIPKELRDTMEIPTRTPLEIFVDGEKIILRKYMPTCVFCGEGNVLRNFKGKNICKDCLGELI